MTPYYLGDGVYVKRDNRDPSLIILYTFDGITESNHIFLSNGELNNLKGWLEREMHWENR